MWILLAPLKLRVLCHPMPCIITLMLPFLSFNLCPFFPAAGKKTATKLMYEGMKDRALCPSLNDGNRPGDLKVGLTNINEIVEKRQEGSNKVGQEHERSAKSVIGLEVSKKTPNEVPKLMDLPRATEKRLFIRSRL